MRVVGRESSKTPVVVGFELSHGMDPGAELARRGFRITGYWRCERRGGDLELTVLVAPSAGPVSRESGLVRREPGLDPSAEVLTKQRIAAYAVVRSERGLLATQFSHRTGAPGRWGLPGGGIDPDEQPADAVLREIGEETAQQVDLGPLLTVTGDRWIGTSPTGIVEDYHAVRVIYLADCPAPSDPQVLDVDGTTAAARWIALPDWAGLDWTEGWRTVLSSTLDPW